MTQMKKTVPLHNSKQLLDKSLKGGVGNNFNVKPPYFKI